MKTEPVEERGLLEGQHRVLELIARGAPMQRSLDLLLELIEAESPGMLCSILLLDPDGLHLRHASAPRLPAEYTNCIDGAAIGPKVGSCGTAAYLGERVIVEDIATDALWEDYRAYALPFGLRACWSTPIFDAERRVLGTFAMYFGEPGRPDESHLRLIELSTYIASIAIAQHRAAEEIRRREEQLVEAQHLANLGSYEWDPRSNRVWRSDELCRIFGLSPEEFEPTFEGYLNRIHPEDRPATLRTIETAFRDAQPFDFEERIVRSDGAIRILHSNGKWTLDDAGRPIRLIGACQDITERKRTERQLSALSARLIHAQEEERVHLARELHDDLSQAIAALSIAAGNLRRAVGESNVKIGAQSGRLQEKLIELSESVRRISHSLHPAVLQHSGLGAALEGYCTEWSELTAMKVEFETAGEFENLPGPVILCVYRVAQEALQNVLKHSRVDRARVELERTADTVTLTVSDRGAGIGAESATSPGLGIVSMKERARMVNGKLSIESRPNEGTTLRLTVPVG
jgi:PAS domain S-box-containing protein